MIRGHCRVLEDDVGLGILVVPQTDQDNITLVDPHLLSQLTTNVAEPNHTVEANGIETAVTQHLGHLGILCNANAREEEGSAGDAVLRRVMSKKSAGSCAR